MAGPMMRIVLSVVAFATPKLIERAGARQTEPQPLGAAAGSDPLDIDGYKSILGGVLSSRS